MGVSCWSRIKQSLLSSASQPEVLANILSRRNNTISGSVKSYENARHGGWLIKLQMGWLSSSYAELFHSGHIKGTRETLMWSYVEKSDLYLLVSLQFFSNGISCGDIEMKSAWNEAEVDKASMTSGHWINMTKFLKVCHLLMGCVSTRRKETWIGLHVCLSLRPQTISHNSFDANLSIWTQLLCKTLRKYVHFNIVLKDTAK